MRAGERSEGGSADRVLTLPNALSALRLVGVPLFLWLVLTEHDGLAVAVLMVSGVTDYAGRLARPHAGTRRQPRSGSCSTRPPTGSTSWPR